MEGGSFNYFGEIAAALGRELKKTVKEVASTMVDDLAVGAPEDTGYLAANMYVLGHTWSKFSTVKYRGTGYQLQQRESFPLLDMPADDYEAVVAVGATYGIYVEMGTRFMPAQPYFYPALDKAQQYLDFLLGLIEGDIKGEIEAL